MPHAAFHFSRGAKEAAHDVQMLFQDAEAHVAKATDTLARGGSWDSTVEHDTDPYCVHSELLRLDGTTEPGPDGAHEAAPAPQGRAPGKAKAKGKRRGRS